jgi:hypothetical protein
MKSNTVTNIITVLFLVSAGGASQQAAAQSALDGPPADSPNRFGLSYRMGFNVNVQFKNLGGFPAQTAPPGPEAGGFVNRNYDNGYNHVDNSRNTYLGYAPATRNYSYMYDGTDGVHPSQVVGNGSAGPTVIVMQSSSSPADVAGNKLDDDPIPGFELTYSRELFHTGSARWGFEAALGYSDLTVNDNSTYNGDVATINDAFEVPADTLTGARVVPPPGPTSGGAGTPLLGSIPTRSLTSLAAGDPGSAIISGQREFHANLYGLRLGPCIEIPLSRKLALAVSGGFALVYVESDFRYNETVTIPGVAGSVNNAGSGSHSGWLPGGYVAANLSVALSKKWALVAGAQFEDVGRYTQSVNEKQATLDLSKSIFVTLGLAYSF